MSFLERSPSGEVLGRTDADRLRRTIEGELIPRLLMAHRAGPVPPSILTAAARELSHEHVEAFVSRVLSPDETAASSYVKQLMDEGISIEGIYLDLLAPTAISLGESWERDACDFVEVTVAVGRLQRVLRDVSHLFIAGGTRNDTVGSARLSCVPGEQHTLGLLMVAEFFIRDGWGVRIGAPLSQPELSGMVRDSSYDVVGFSVACASRLSVLKQTIRRVRRESQNRDVAILVGGQAFINDPSLVARVGADGTSIDARSAPNSARTLITRPESS